MRERRPSLLDAMPGAADSPWDLPSGLLAEIRLVMWYPKAGTWHATAEGSHVSAEDHDPVSAMKKAVALRGHAYRFEPGGRAPAPPAEPRRERRRME